MLSRMSRGRWRKLGSSMLAQDGGGSILRLISVGSASLMCSDDDQETNVRTKRVVTEGGTTLYDKVCMGLWDMVY